MRVTKLPQYKDQFAPDGKIYFSVRETRLGIKSWSQTSLGKLKVNFDFDLFGVGLCALAAKAPVVAAWIMELAKQNKNFSLELLDLGKINLPMVNLVKKNSGN